MPQGYFVISDITGYTGFLTQSELDHAQDILKTLFDTLLDEMKAPLIISNFQGDAILTYAPVEAVPRGESLLEQVESIYLSYTHKLDLMKNNTTCQCKACANMKSLDLKFFIHFGEYLLQDMRGKAELSGADVIIAHRMMKNNVKEQTGLKAYALFSKAAIQQLGLDDFTAEMHPHSEEYEHIGEVPMYAYCLKTMWEKRRDERRVRVSPEETWLELDYTVNAPASFVWDCYLRPDLRAEIEGVKAARITDKQNGRATIGTSLHCNHGNFETHHLILDLEPLKYLTERLAGLPMSFAAQITFEIQTHGEHSHVKVRLLKPQATQVFFRAISPFLLGMFQKEFKKRFDSSYTIMNQIAKRDLQVLAH